MNWDFIDFNNNNEDLDINSSLILRQNRDFFTGFNSEKGKGLSFGGGDIVKIIFNKGGMVYSFEGICLALKKKKVFSKNATLVLRNVIDRVGIEIIAGYYFNRIYNMQFNDFKRKRFMYRKTRLFYLRERVNRQSKV